MDHRPSPGAAAPQEPTPAATDAAPLRVLLVEDLDDLRETSLLLLELLGAHAQGAADAEAAEALLARERFDVLITDITLPGRSGVELATSVSASQPDLKLVFCSGYGAPKLPAGMRSWSLPKPYDLPQLEGLLAQLRAVR